MSFEFVFREYPEPKPLDFIGYWGPVTATIDWCEENYVISPFFAEFINATTNLSFFILSMYHLYSALKNKLGNLFIFVSIGMGVVGLGSWFFHMTLKYEFQLMDELPMIYVTAIPSAYLFGYGNSVFIKKLTCILVFTAMLVMTIIYCFIYKDPVIHQICYAFLNFAIIIRSLLLTNKKVKDQKQRIFLYKLLFKSFSLFAFGFFIWNIDNEFCIHLINLRRNLFGIPLGFLLEGHGWWHIFTSLGIYNFVLYMEILVTYLEGLENNYDLIWKWKFFGQLVLKPNMKSLADVHIFEDDSKITKKNI
ncbi:hypothetical protein PACTADRAFT_4486 [Pachysolen tannophilus NRRL Y-2460]|uniref:Alkaline ceramidase n=1 Tax=Pachysolen tannophilus NRRL Y-2460 TaxID=669874 RepID=A0A1E4TP96_PACTA|nr:hypothetical protein PACTADRAFT_4486 [Pachysolen tannophilus NRRL Y-2460]